MTSEEARLQVDTCEKQVLEAYNSLWHSARSVAPAAIEAQTKRKTNRIMFALVIALVGVVIWLASHPFWGIVVLGFSLFLGYAANEEETAVINDIKKRQEQLNSMLDQNTQI